MIINMSCGSEKINNNKKTNSNSLRWKSHRCGGRLALGGRKETVHFKSLVQLKSEFTPKSVSMWKSWTCCWI